MVFFLSTMGIPGIELKSSVLVTSEGLYSLGCLALPAPFTFNSIEQWHAFSEHTWRQQTYLRYTNRI